MVKASGYKKCLACGGDINNDAHTCSFCGNCQKKERASVSVPFKLFLGVIVFLAILFLGVMSGLAVSKYTCFRKNLYNARALKSISIAKNGLEKYRSRTGKYPATLDLVYPEPEEGISMFLRKTSNRGYVLFGLHVLGDEEYMTMSDNNFIFTRKRNARGPSLPLFN